MQMSKVAACDVTRCAYNQEKECHALAITVGDLIHPHCDTYLEAPMKGGDAMATAGVGACKVTVCRYNEELECQASAIKVGFMIDEADCLTFEKV